MKPILVLTPDGVGSTFLQRSLCIFGNLSDTDWYNVHELTNGIKFNGVHLEKDWSLKYTQSLNEIKTLLENNDHNLIGRIASYHIINRKDPAAQANKFYKFLNDTFIIVACYRSNVFEYAHSWTIREYKKVLNVYSFAEKNTVHPATDQFELDVDYFESKLKDYNQYIYWIQDHFNVAYKFDYDELQTVDNFIVNILGLDSNVFLDKFGISLNEYCHLSNLSNLDNLPNNLKKSFAEVRIFAHKLIQQKKMPNSLPLKMNSFGNKIKKTTNFRQLIDRYNKVVESNNELSTVDYDALISLAANEQFGKNSNQIIEQIKNRFV